MPRPVAVSGADGLPLWDTFEAFFFLLAGLSVGLAFGLLFPSLWRTLRRRFRNPERFAPHDLNLAENVALPQLPFSDAMQSEGTDDTTYAIAQLFVVARSHVQNGNLRDAVKVYLRILAHEQVSSQQTNRTLFELSQTYRLLGLHSRAFDTCFELLHRKPKNSEVLAYLLDLSAAAGLVDRIQSIVDAFEGKADDALRLQIAHAYCSQGDTNSAAGQQRTAMDAARKAVRWEVRSARARLLLWQVTSSDLWQKGGSDPHMLWIALATDLESRWQISEETGVSPCAASAYLGSRLAHLSAVPASTEAFDASLQSEFHLVCKRNMLSAQDEKRFNWIIMMGAFALLNSESFLKDTSFLRIFELLVGNSLGGIRLSDACPKTISALRSAFQIHRCLNCHTFAVEFTWQCSHCLQRETFSQLHGPA